MSQPRFVVINAHALRYEVWQRPCPLTPARMLAAYVSGDPLSASSVEYLRTADHPLEGT